MSTPSAMTAASTSGQEEVKLIELMKVHLNSFIATEIDARLLQSCVQFFSERKEFPQIHNILDIYRDIKATESVQAVNHNYNHNGYNNYYGELKPTDANLAADCLGQLVTSPRMQAVWNDFLQQFICRFGTFPLTKDVEYSFNFYYSEQRFPNPDELLSMEILEREVFNREIHEDEADREQRVEEKVEYNDISFLDKLKFKQSSETAITATTAITTANANDCSLCLNEYCDGDELVRLPCSHVFHYGKTATVKVATESANDECAGISTWLKRGVNCPLCKAVCIWPSEKSAKRKYE